MVKNVRKKGTKAKPKSAANSANGSTTTSSAEDLAAQVDAMVEQRMDEILDQMSLLMDQKLQKVYSEIDRIKNLADANALRAAVEDELAEETEEAEEQEQEQDDEVNQGDLPDLAALSMEDVEKPPPVCVYAADPTTIPDRCCPLPRSVSVADYLRNRKVAETIGDRDDRELRMMQIFAKHSGEITADLLKQVILCDTGARELMAGLEGCFEKWASEDLNEQCDKIWQAFNLAMNDEWMASMPSVIQETVAEESIRQIADEVGLSQIALKPRTAAGLDADLNIRRKLLLEFSRDKFHVFDYLEHLRDALVDSPLSHTLKCRRLNHLLPAAWREWYSAYDVQHVSTITECLNHPIPRRITETVAKTTIDHVIEFLTMFIEYKDNAAIGDQFFATKSWAPPAEETDDENAYLLWQEGTPAKKMRKASRFDLMKDGFLTEAQMETVYQNSLKSARYDEQALGEFYLACHPFTRWMKSRLERETDLVTMAGERLADIARMLGHQGLLQTMQMSMDASLQTPHIPNANTFHNLSQICYSIDLEYVG